MAKSPMMECQDCVSKFTVSSSGSLEPVAYCPFCGSGAVSDNNYEDDDEDDDSSDE